MPRELPPSRTAPQFVVRFPSESMRDSLAEAAKKQGRSINSEIVSRLQRSLEAGDGDAGDLAVLQAGLDQQRALASQFQAIGDLSDSGRSIVAALLLSALDALPPEKWPGGVDAGFALHLAQWLQEKDPRGAAFSLVKLIDGADAETVDTLRRFAGHVEDLGIDRISQVQRLATAAATADALRKNKVIMVGNVGAEDAPSRKGPSPSKNARRPPFKKR